MSATWIVLWLNKTFSGYKPGEVKVSGTPYSSFQHLEGAHKEAGEGLFTRA